MQTILVILAILIGIIIFSVTIVRYRDEWFGKRLGPSAPTPPPQTQQTANSGASANNNVPTPTAPAPKADKSAGVMVRSLLWVGSVVALAVMIVGGVKFSGNKPKPTLPKTQVASYSTSPPWEVVEPLFSGCESGDGTPGSGRQFRDKKGGGLEVIRGPQKEGANAVGFVQVNIGDPRVVAFLAKNGLSEKDAEESEEENRRAGKLLYEEFLKTGGTHPWEASRGCWAPLLAQRGFGREGYTKIVVAPTETFGEVTIPEGYRVKFDWGENTISLVRNEEKPVTLGPKDHYKGGGKTETLKIRSEEGHPLEIKLEFTPI